MIYLDKFTVGDIELHEMKKGCINKYAALINMQPRKLSRDFLNLFR